MTLSLNRGVEVKPSAVFGTLPRHSSGLVALVFPSPAITTCVPCRLFSFYITITLATGYGLDYPGSSFGMDKMFLLSTPYRPATGSTQHCIQWVPGALSPEGKAGRGVKLTTYLHLIPRSRKMELYLNFPICLHGILLN
jgi:hypothetical protein